MFASILVFLLVTGGVAAVTSLLTRRENLQSVDGFFLGGRHLSWVVVGGSLLLTNLSTEQMVGLNGAAYIDGLAVIAWEVIAVLALLAFALFFLPRYLESNVATLPEFLATRFDAQLAWIVTLFFLLAYVFLLLPIILYTGATGLIGILDLQQLLGLSSARLTLSLVVAAVGVIGAAYALLGGLKAVAVSDTLNGVGVIVGGFLITVYGLQELGGGSLHEGWTQMLAQNEGRLSSLGDTDSSVPASTLLTGVLLINLFYWTCNQQIIQRALGAKSLAEAQKGVFLAAGFKLIGPLYLVVPGLIAYALFSEAGTVAADQSYGRLVNLVLPPALSGFFAAVLLGAILSSFNSALNSTCTLFSLSVLRARGGERFSEADLVRYGRQFGLVVSVFAMLVAPLLAGQDSIWSYLQRMNGIYFIPILLAVVTALFWPQTPPRRVKSLVLGSAGLILTVYFLPPFSNLLSVLHEYHFLGFVFVIALALMILPPADGEPRPQNQSAPILDMAPWPATPAVAGFLALVVLAIYGLLA